MKLTNRFLVKGGIVLFLFLGFCIPCTLAAQSNHVIDRVLAQEELRYAEGAYLAFAAAGLLSETAGPEEAYDLVRENRAKWKLKEPSPEKKMRLGDFSYILMRTLEIKGGLMYRIFPGPRYAARELDHLGIIKQVPSPYRPLSGREAIQILGDTLEWKEAGR